MGSATCLQTHGAPDCHERSTSWSAGHPLQRITNMENPDRWDVIVRGQAACLHRPWTHMTAADLPGVYLVEEAA